MSELNLKLAEIQLGLHAAKGQRNDFGKYAYRSAEDIMQALKPLLGDATVRLSDSIENIGDRFYVRAKATLQMGDDQVVVHAYARECLSKKGMDDAQLTGSCSSYARKYALCGLFLIDDNKDIDEMDNKSNPSQSQADLDVAEFIALYTKKDLDGIIELWSAAKLNKPRATATWQLMSDEIRKIITEAAK